jgi:hypothetical protein
LNCLVDTLLKKEFDLHRAGGTPHPLMVREGIDAIPFPHPMLDEWRQNFKAWDIFMSQRIFGFVAQSMISGLTQRAR